MNIEYVTKKMQNTTNNYDQKYFKIVTTSYDKKSTRCNFRILTLYWL